MKLAVAIILWSALVSGVGADPAALQALNDLRAGAGKAPLSHSAPLEEAATAHARDMVRGGFFDHRGSDGSSVGDRVHRQGYGWCFVAENIATGQGALAEVMRDWAASPGHRRNMLSEEAREFALVQVADRIWVMVLAAPGC